MFIMLMGLLLRERFVVARRVSFAPAATHIRRQYNNKVIIIIIIFSGFFAKGAHHNWSEEFVQPAYSIISRGKETGTRFNTTGLEYVRETHILFTVKYTKPFVSGLSFNRLDVQIETFSEPNASLYTVRTSYSNRVFIAKSFFSPRFETAGIKLVRDDFGKCYMFLGVAENK